MTAPATVKPEQLGLVPAGVDPTTLPATWWALLDLVPWEGNPNEHPQAQVDALAKLIRRHGFTSVLQVHHPSRVILAGHGRRQALLQVLEGDPAWSIPGCPGPGYVPVRWYGGTWEQARAQALADNRIALEALRDDQAVARIMAELHQGEADELTRAQAIADDTAYQADEVADLLRQLARKPKPRDVKPPRPCAKPEHPTSKPGELFELGPHRLICGNARDPEVVRRLLEGRKADVALTDPPYSSGGFQESGRPAGSVGRRTTSLRAESKGQEVVKIAGDTLSTRGFQRLIADVLANLASEAKVPLAYVFLDWRMWCTLWDLAEDCNGQVRGMIVWGKPTPGLGSGWRAQHELIMPITWAGDLFDKQHGKGNVIDLTSLDAVDGQPLIKARRTRNKLHYTEKPVEVIEALLAPTPWALEVIDTFAGSGTTLIAAARLERRADLIELDPGWCDVIRDRWTRWAREAKVDPGPGALTLEGQVLEGDDD